MESQRSTRAYDVSPESPAQYPIQPSRCICDVKVTVSRDSRYQLMVQLEWLDAVCERQRQDFYGHTAQQIATDLHAATLLGEVPRQMFLIGLIRGLYIERHTD